MRAGQLDQRIVIERLTQTRDEWGGVEEAWTTHLTTWAAVEPLMGREFMAAAALVSEITTKVRIRYRAGITTADRIRHRGRVYGITSVADVKSANDELLLMVKAIG